MLSPIGLVLSKIQMLPLSLDAVLAIMPLFYFGSILPRLKVEHQAYGKMIICFIFHILAFIQCKKSSVPYLDINQRFFPLYPFCFVMAIFGTLMFCELAFIISNNKVIGKPLKYLGKYSLYMFMVHSIESVCTYILWENVFDNIHLNTFLRVIQDIVIFIIVMFFRECRKKEIL